MKHTNLSVDDWFDQLRMGLEYREEYGYEDNWNRVEGIFYQQASTRVRSGSNLIYSTGDAFLAEMHTSNPLMLVEPQREDQIEWAPVVESLSNNLICVTKLRAEMETASLYSYLWGSGFVKLGYDSEFGWAPEHDLGGQMNPMGLTLTMLSRTQQRIEHSNNKPGMPWAAAVAPHDIVVPWGTRSLENCPWIAHRVVRHIEEVRADAKYTGTRQLEPVMSMKDFVQSYTTVMKPYRVGSDVGLDEVVGQKEYVEMWEIHDKRTGQIHVVAQGHKKFLRSDINHLQIKGLPFTEVSFVPRGRTMWRTSDALYLLGHQAELDDITAQARKQRRINVTKFLTRKGAISPENMRKATSKEVGMFVEVEAGANLQEAIFKLDSTYTNESLYREMEDVRNSSRETVGFDRNSYGEYKGARTTAREVDSVQLAKGRRMGRRKTSLAEAYVDVVRKLNSFAFKFWKLPMVLQTVGQTGAVQWVNFTPSEINGEYNMKIYFDDGETPTMESRQGEAMGVYQASYQDPMIDPMMARINLARSYHNAAISASFLPYRVSQMGQGQAGGQQAGLQQGAGGQGSGPSPQRAGNSQRPGVR